MTSHKEWAAREAARLLYWGASRWSTPLGYSESYIKSVADTLLGYVPPSDQACRAAMQALSNVMVWVTLEAYAQRLFCVDYVMGLPECRQLAFGKVVQMGWFDLAVKPRSKK